MSDRGREVAAEGCDFGVVFPSLDTRAITLISKIPYEPSNHAALSAIDQIDENPDD